MQSMLRLRPAVILLFLLPLLLPFVDGQQPGLWGGPPNVEVTCVHEDGAAQIDVSPTGTNYITSECTIENSSSGTEKIEIEYGADGLNVVGPTEVTVGGAQSVVIQVAVAATEGMAPQTRNISVAAEVVDFNGIPIAEQIRPSDESNVLIEILSYSDFTVDISPNSLKMDAGGMPGSVTVLVRNMGNDADVYDLSVATTDLAARGFNVSIPDTVVSAPKGGSASFTISLTPPDELSTEKIEVKVTVTSREHDIRLSKSEVFTVNATAAETSILDFSSMNIPTWAWASGGILASLVALAVVGSLIRKKRSGSQYEVEYEEDEDDFDEDLDDLDDDLDDLDDDLDDLDHLDMDLDDLDF